MRTLALLAAITMVLMAHALPRPDLAVRQGVDDLSNDKHIFHHLDRNQRTANRDREHMHRDNAEEPGAYVVRRLPNGSQQARSWTMARERVVNRRFMQDPDYSEGDSGGGSNSGNPASNTTPTQQPPAKAEKPGGTANNHGRY